MNDDDDAMPTISIIIPHLNQPAFLKRCLLSLKPQINHAHVLEVIVVDNGSKELPESLCAEFDKVRLEECPEPGPGPARNHGIAKSRGDILAFIDADCIADPNWVSTIYGCFIHDASIRVIGGDVRIAYEDQHDLTMLEAYESVYAYRQKMYIEKMGFSGTGNLAMRREAYQKVGPFAGLDVAEDRDWGRRATGSGIKIHYVKEMIAFHPARKTFAELCLKWDRHISHDFEDKAQGLSGKMRWLILTAAVGLSPLAECLTILKSPRIKSFHNRLSAFICVIKIRLYRSIKMLSLLFSLSPSEGSSSWNRGK